MDLCGPSLTQAVAAEMLARGTLQGRLPGVVALYGRKREVMIETLQSEMPAGVSWTRPEGGLFLWVRLPDEIDAGAMLKAAVQEEGVAYVPGQAFHCDGSGRNTMRLNFSYPPVEEIREGITRLARMVTRQLDSTVSTIGRPSGSATVSE
jgi:2-aminoadipate transaminase